MKRKTVLIVDEDRQFVQTVANCCRHLGLQVQVAHSAVQAMGKMDEALPDLVCLDVHMPTGNSLSICQMMATEPAAAKVPVIVLTERKDEETIRRAADLCAYFVRKDDEVTRRIEPVIFELLDIEPSVAEAVTGCESSTAE